MSVNLDKNTELVNDPNKTVLEFTQRIPVGGQEAKKSFNIKANVDSSSTSSIKMKGEMEQVMEKSYRFCPNCGVALEPAIFSSDITFQTGCKNKVCRSDLTLDAFMKDMEREPYFVIGSSSKMVVSVIVKNQEESEPAYKPKVIIKYPASLKISQLIVDCGDNEEDKILTCYFPGPLLQGADRM